MKNLIIKVLALIVILAISVCLVGCGSEGGKSQGYKGDVIDLGGREISVVTWSNSFIPDQNSSSQAVQDSYARMKEVEKLYNCKFVVNNMEASEISSAFTTAAMAGQSIGDIIYMKTNMATSALNNNLLFDLSKVFDFSNSTYYKAASDLLKSSDGNIYSFGISDYHSVDNMIYFNKDVFDEVGIDIDELYECVENGEWTIQKYDEILSRAAIVENGETVVYGGIGTTSFGGIHFWLEAFGAEVVHLGEDGKATSGLRDAQFTTALEFVRENNQKSYVLKPSNDDAWDMGLARFYNGTLATTIASTGHHQNMKENCTFEYGILPFPKASADDDYSYTKNYLNVYVMPKTFDKDLETAKAIADMVTYFATHKETRSEVELKKELEAYYCDEQSVEIAFTATQSDNYRVQNVYTIGLDNSFSTVAHKALNPALHGTATVAPAIASIADAWESTLNDYNSSITK